MNRQKDQEDTKFVCHGCIGDDFLANEVKEQSHPRQCTYCYERRQAIPLEELADLIHEALQEHYELTPSEPEGIDYVLAKEGLWHRPGWPVEDVIGDMAGISSEIASDVTERLAHPPRRSPGASSRTMIPPFTTTKPCTRNVVLMT